MTNGLLNVNEDLARLEPWYDTDMRGLRVQRVPTWDEWSVGIRGMAHLMHALPMIIGDYINVGEDTFGESYEQALDIFGEYSYGTVANYASICRAVPYERRREGLTMAHLKAIRSLEPVEQVEWQQRAIENKWTSVELWENVHNSVPTFPSIVDELIEAIGNLYAMANDGMVENCLANAQNELRIAKDIYEEQAQGTQAQIAG